MNPTLLEIYNADKIVVGVTMELPSLHLCCVGSGVSPHLPDTAALSLLTAYSSCLPIIISNITPALHTWGISSGNHLESDSLI